MPKGKLHVSDDGVSRPCSTDDCPLGPLVAPDGSLVERPHFNTKEEGRAFFEQHMKPALFASSQRKNRLKLPTGFKNLSAVGGALVLSFSVTACDVAANPATIAPPTSTPTTSSSPTPTSSSVRDKVSSAEQKTRDGLDKISDTIAKDSPSWKQTAKDKAGQLSEAAKREAAKVRDSVNQAKTSGNSGSSVSGSGSDVKVSSKGVYFQGKSLTPTQAEIANAKAQLAKLHVAPEKSVNYNRAEQFGRSFQTGVVGGLEHRDIPNATFVSSSSTSRASGGSFVDPYSGKTVTIVKGSSQDTAVDHVVALSEAYKSGADSWSQEQRLKYANDPNVLAVVDHGVNSAKSDYDASQWLPSYAPAQCRFVIAQISIKSSYNLNVDSKEKEALSSVLSSRCG